MENLLNTVDFFEKKMTPEELADYMKSLGFVNITGETIVYDDGTEWAVTTTSRSGIGYNNGYTAVNTESGDVWIAKGVLTKEQINKIIYTFTGIKKNVEPIYGWGNSSVPLGVEGKLKNENIVINTLKKEE